MSVGANPCLSLAIARLTSAGSDNFAIWVLNAPLPGGYVHHDCIWPLSLTRKWLAWQEMFSPEGSPHLPVTHNPDRPLTEELIITPDGNSPPQGYGARLMQDLGIALWQWLLSGSIRNSFAQSRGIAIGQSSLLRLRLDIRDPNLIPLPWEIMQPEAGKPSISLNQRLLFSRTISNVDPLSQARAREELNILLVLGQSGDRSQTHLDLEAEAATLTQAIHQNPRQNPYTDPVPAQVRTLLQPTPAELINALETGVYNVLFYAGHGVPAPDGGLLFLRPDAEIGGTELAQVLVRTQVTLAVFNACWGAQPERLDGKTVPRSSLAEVSIQHGVPAVLAMRDSIADREALSFIQIFTKAIAERMPIDLAAAVARQQLLTLYKFNQPAWTLPILYMHPEFAGELIRSLDQNITELPTTLPNSDLHQHPPALLRSLKDETKVWLIRGGLMNVGRRKGNDLVLDEKWVSNNHARIVRREKTADGEVQLQYFLQDESRYGTYISNPTGWQKIHHQEIMLNSGIQMKFGSLHGQALEFAIEE